MDELKKNLYARAFGIALRESTPTAADRAEMILTEARLLLAIRDAEGGQDAADEKGV